ncbi:hypothetical protein NSQ14_12665 [Caldifermentibacillus hisashii]|uniref:hypothetical protein n=1 Tax=Caldifermentibacillus hisashii TaxID=996558 RepID=UPI0031FC0D34
MANIQWKTKEEIEAEQSAPKPLTRVELLEQENIEIKLALAELAEAVLGGD